MGPATALGRLVAINFGGRDHRFRVVGAGHGCQPSALTAFLRKVMMINGFQHFSGCLDGAAQVALLADVRRVIAAAPLYTPTMPRSGKPLSVRMTNCGLLGWMTDAAGGYRYQAYHPVTGAPWPPIPGALVRLWQRVAPDAPPAEACLINYYGPDARMGSHVDADETDRTAPVVSISLGDDAIFHVGGLARSDAKVRVVLRSGDVAVLGGNARRAYHGIDKVVVGTSALLAEGGRFNLTLRRVTRSQSD